jgi:hypothetical protein
MWRRGFTWPLLVFSLIALAGSAFALPAMEQSWERTPDGWRRLPVVQPRPRFDSSGLHPLVLAAGQLTLSLFMLTAFPAKEAPTGKPAEDRVR